MCIDPHTWNHDGHAVDFVWEAKLYTMDKWVADEAGTEVSTLPTGQLACVSTVPVRVSPELDHTLVPLRETWAKVPFPEFQGFLVEPEAVGHCTGWL